MFPVQLALFVLSAYQCSLTASRAFVKGDEDSLTQDVLWLKFLQNNNIFAQ